MPDLPIFDYELELTLIGWMLGNPDHWPTVTDECRPEDFYTPSLAKAYLYLLQDGHLAVEEIASRCDIDPNLLRTWRFNAKVSGARDVHQLATLVAKMALRRRLQRDLAVTLDEIQDPSTPEAEIISRLRERIETAVVPDSPPEDPSKPVLQFVREVNFDYDWLIPHLLERRDRMIVTAHGGVGKSTLLRQIALCCAAGIHPFTGIAIRPLRVLLLDLENADRQVARGLEGPLEKIGPFDEMNLRIIAHPQVMDITTDAGWRWLSSHAAQVEPDLIVGGPVYRMYASGDTSKDMGGRDKAVQAAKQLDRLRDRYDCGLILEAHPPKEADHLAPWGSYIWSVWSEFGIGLRPVEKDDPSVVYWTHWRFPRDKRDWPSILRRGGAYGFEVR